MRSPTLSTSNESTALITKSNSDEDSSEILYEEIEEEQKMNEESKNDASTAPIKQLTTPKRAKSTFPFGKCKSIKSSPFKLIPLKTKF